MILQYLYSILFEMKKIIGSILFAATSAIAFAQSIDAPIIDVKDTWVYLNTVEKGANGWSQTHDEITVTRATSSSIYYATKVSGSSQPPRELISGSDWSRKRDVNGVETTVATPISFPLKVGKSWDLEYSEQRPNKVHAFEKWFSTYKVVGYEQVEVPAGKFNALKIESEGKWTAQLEPTNTITQGAQTSQSGVTAVTQIQETSADTITGRTYKAYWYVPEIKRWVKFVEEYYTSGGVRNERYTGELESFKAAKQ